MAKLPTRTTRIHGEGIRLALITAEFNKAINDAMLKDAHKTARRLGAHVTIDVHAPGVYDIPLLAQAALKRRDVDALVAIGAVITGETRHDEVVTFTTAKTLQELALRFEKPVGLAITGPGQTEKQARARIDRAAWAVETVCKEIRTLRALNPSHVGAR